ncbi:MAG: AbrB/MazE/SpoVT family DNA-binding domain-containing protein [Candidatus Bathyarchaeales archaeon]
MSNTVEILEKFFKTAVDYRGRFYIPKQVRKILQIKEGERVYIKIEKDHFKVYTAKALKSQRNENDTETVKP